MKKKYKILGAAAASATGFSQGLLPESDFGTEICGGEFENPMVGVSDTSTLIEKEYSRWLVKEEKNLQNEVKATCIRNLNPTDRESEKEFLQNLRRDLKISDCRQESGKYSTIYKFKTSEFSEVSLRMISKFHMYLTVQMKGKKEGKDRKNQETYLYRCLDLLLPKDFSKTFYEELFKDYFNPSLSLDNEYLNLRD
eukprot:GHVP01049955.1.p1 GENE.GHVP01049955.1~~GHVP01049955.1.p1  ORF type:complete len:196 (-),score=32.21 GHVP01049955.1:190-777(-)